MNKKIWLGALALCSAALCHALDVKFEPVAPGVYAHIGDLGGRSADNEGLNANIGLVVTPQGAVLIDSGATHQSARRIHDAVRAVTAQPVRWVINTGGQDHRWLGNGYFASQGAELIAHANAAPDMRSRGGDQLAALRSVLGDKASGTVPTLATRWIDADDSRIDLGGVVFELRHRGGGHTPGDMMVWLPGSRVLFTGDIVYVQRLLGVLPVSHTRHWLETFALIEPLAPAHIVPGHGPVTDLSTAQAHTRDYLLALRAHMAQAVSRLDDIGVAVRSFDGRPFEKLLNAAELMPGNANRVYLEMERE
ncbi:MAG: MBL fold metallo-hydrolase [Hydrogenophaga sp.]|uniref:MBL fold metallo-hydrolase n=1 Tax=Hydrogenophaga sp. TaxID=1904254 RepID=UPI00261E956C|nr:MBL fold metallo-hydrolase [Hydrogenophaga sp.]MCV0438764.1 MBL fold metallo-hydrolase [Hydrogenophaga sp.]